MEGRRTDSLFTRREREVVDYIVRGYSLRETADKLCVVYQCIANHTQSIYDKAGIFEHRTLNALTSWWFRTNFDINLCEVARRIGASGLLLLFCTYTFGGGDNDQIVRRVRRGRRSEYELINE